MVRSTIPKVAIGLRRLATLVLHLAIVLVVGVPLILRDTRPTRGLEESGIPAPVMAQAQAAPVGETPGLAVALAGAEVIGAAPAIMPSVTVGETWSANILQWSEPISLAAIAYGLDPDLIAAVILMESGGNKQASGPSGEVGLMQIMPYHSCVAWDPASNIDCGAQLLSGKIERAGGDIRSGLAAYNAGETGRDRDGKGWGYANTVLARYNRAKGG